MKCSIKRCIQLTVAAAMLAINAGCSGPYVKEFREVAGADLQSGVLSVLTGVVDGVFAVYDPDNPDGTG